VLAGYAKTTPPIFTKFGENVAHGPWKKSLDFNSNSDHFTSGLWLGLGLGKGTAILRMGGLCYPAFVL